MTTSILVTGGTGTLGRLVVARLRAAGRDVRVLSRHSHESLDGAEFVAGNLLTGDGVDAAVQGIEVIVHCAGTQKGDPVMTRNLVQAASRVGSPHLVYISVVGADRIPVVGFGRVAFAYFGAKRQAEGIVEASGLPWTILRATQFHDLFLMTAKAMAKLPLIPVPAGFRFEPIDADVVAARLVELALGAPAGYVPDLGGPRVYRMTDLIRSYLRAAHKRRLLVPAWIGGKSARAVRAGGNLVAEPAVSDQPRDGKTWEAFLTERVGERGIPVAA